MSARPTPRPPSTPSPVRGRSGAAPHRIDGSLLRKALAGGRLRMGALELTILQALDAELRRREEPARSRRRARRRAARFLADHAERRSPPGADEVRRWVEEMALRGGIPRGERASYLRTVSFLYTRVLHRPAP